MTGCPASNSAHFSTNLHSAITVIILKCKCNHVTLSLKILLSPYIAQITAATFHPSMPHYDLAPTYIFQPYLPTLKAPKGRICNFLKCLDSSIAPSEVALGPSSLLLITHPTSTCLQVFSTEETISGPPVPGLDASINTYY